MSLANYEETMNQYTDMAMIDW